MKTVTYNFPVSPSNGKDQFLIQSVICKEYEDSVPFITHHFILEGRNNSVTFDIGDQLTPGMLRQWADELSKRLVSI